MNKAGAISPLQALLFLSLFLSLPVSLGLFLGIKFIKRTSGLLIKLKENERSIIAFLLMLLLFLPSIATKNAAATVIFVLIYLFILSFLLPTLFMGSFKKILFKHNISTFDFLKIDRNIFDNMELKKDAGALIGYSMKRFEPIYLDKNTREKHTLISGSTGSGKTTMLKSLFIDAMINDDPVLIIDPKGNIETINEFQMLANKYSQRSRIVEVFSLISPENSLSYNPLKRGNPVQIKDRLISSLEWSEQYYKNQAAAWVGKVVQIFDALDMEISIPLINKILIDRKFAEEIELKIKGLKDKNLAKVVHEQLNRALKVDPQKLDNLIAQISDLNNKETGFLLEKTSSNQEIDLLDAIKGRRIIYFQLNTMAYDLTARALGRLILADLKSLASEIHGGKVGMKPTFFPIFVDEFGSFCSSSFIEMLKMCRDVKFSLHLFFQSLADLDVVSKEFKSQVQQNCINKFILRTDDPDEVDFWASVAGTSRSNEESFQYKKTLGFNIKTGMGNSRSTREMKIEHDVFKQLEVGQSVFIQKSPSKEDLIQLWYPQ